MAADWERVKLGSADATVRVFSQQGCKAKRLVTGTPYGKKCQAC